MPAPAPAPAPDPEPEPEEPEPFPDSKKNTAWLLDADNATAVCFEEDARRKASQAKRFAYFALRENNENLRVERMLTPPQEVAFEVTHSHSAQTRTEAFARELFESAEVDIHNTPSRAQFGTAQMTFEAFKQQAVGDAGVRRRCFSLRMPDFGSMCLQCIEKTQGVDAETLRRLEDYAT